MWTGKSVAPQASPNSVRHDKLLRHSLLEYLIQYTIEPCVSLHRPSSRYSLRTGGCLSSIPTSSRYARQRTCSPSKSKTSHAVSNRTHPDLHWNRQYTRVECEVCYTDVNAANSVPSQGWMRQTETEHNDFIGEPPGKSANYVRAAYRKATGKALDTTANVSIHLQVIMSNPSYVLDACGHASHDTRASS